MNTLDKYWRTIPTRHGIVLFIALTAFFLLMRFSGLAHVFILRSLNIVFVYLIVRSAINTFHKKAGASYYEDFFDYFKIAMWTGIIGIGLFSVFIALYLDLIDHAFMDMLREHENLGGVISPIIAAFIILLEGLVSVGICAFILIQLTKARTVEKPSNNKTDLKREPRIKN